jgi:hypothetical protein
MHNHKSILATHVITQSGSSMYARVLYTTAMFVQKRAVLSYAIAVRWHKRVSLLRSKVSLQHHARTHVYSALTNQNIT